MIYICGNCGFQFVRSEEAYECPSCERTHVRLATKEEHDEFLKNLKPLKIKEDEDVPDTI